MFLTTDVHRRRSLTFALVAMAWAAVAAEPTISVSARQRYPWNGLVDVHFTITGDAGTKYDTSFTAKDMVGNTNITMTTIRKADGTLANVTKEQLQPGTYSWVWDAAADLPKDFQCDRVTVTGTAVEAHGKVQLWAGGPYWATMNIGATKPEEYGYYFWWGDIIGYKRVNNKWVASDGSSSDFSFDSYNRKTYMKSIANLRSEGWITKDNILATKFDAAHEYWGGGWRMPTYQELNALLSKCDWVNTTRNGVKGYSVLGRGDYSTVSIFFPCAGYGLETSLNNAGPGGQYWSSEPDSDSSSGGYSWGLDIWADEPGYRYHRMWSIPRYRGLPIRPVQGSAE